jgi:hypothetical protein
LELNCLHGSVGQPQSEFLSYLHVKNQWVACRTENILWLPPDYRATCVAVQQNILAMGHASGRVTLIEFDAAKIAFEHSLGTLCLNKQDSPNK